MYIMHACNIIPFQWPRKDKKEKEASKRLVYLNTLSHTSPENLHHSYLFSRNSILSIVYVPCLCIQIILLFIVQFEAHGKVESMVVFIYISCMFEILLVGVKLNHAVMEQDFQC
jgi:hypothetical protein